MKFFITGHTGFKGSWLSVMLSECGHQVFGLALDPDSDGLFERAGLGRRFTMDARGDISDTDLVRQRIDQAQPDVVIHLAAQALVRDSYVRPRWTVQTNVMGTLSVLEAVSAVPSVSALVAVTTDKVYRNVGQSFGYRESDCLGGHDPYSASKAMADLLVQSWVSSFPSTPTAVARAGNVIGGGDTSRDRIMPDLLNAFADGKSAIVRMPSAVRPWQHVLDCLQGYVTLVDALVEGSGRGEWNFGPDADAVRTVAELADTAARHWSPEATWTTGSQSDLHEASLLVLDSSRARTELGWKDRLTFEQAVELTVAWDKRVRRGEHPESVMVDQLQHFMELPA